MGLGCMLRQIGVTTCNVSQSESENDLPRRDVHTV